MMGKSEQDAKIDYAKRLAEAGQHEEALVVLGEVEKKVSKPSALACILKARILFGKGKDADATKTLDKLSAWMLREPDIVLEIWRTYVFIAETHKLEEKVLDAIYAYKKARNVLTENHEEYFNTQLALVNLLLHANYLEDAISEVSALKSSFKYTHPVLGADVYMLIGDKFIDDDMKAFEWYSKAMCLYAKQGRKDKIKELVERLTLRNEVWSQYD